VEVRKDRPRGEPRPKTKYRRPAVPRPPALGRAQSGTHPCAGEGRDADSGHKTRSVFDRYNIVSQDDVLEAGRKLEAYFEEEKGHKKGHTLHQDAASGNLVQ
jgi:hypothetical protein